MSMRHHERPRIAVGAVLILHAVAAYCVCGAGWASTTAVIHLLSLHQAGNWSTLIEANANPADLIHLLRETRAVLAGARVAPFFEAYKRFGLNQAKHQKEGRLVSHGGSPWRRPARARNARMKRKVLGDSASILVHVSPSPTSESDRKKRPGKPSAMPTYEALRNRHQSRRPYSWPPREYDDLTKADIAALAAVLIPPPPPNTSASAAFPHEIRRLIVELPSHLRCRCPCLSTLCAAHKRLNPLPLISLLDSIRRNVEHELHMHWTPLSAEGSITAAQSHLIARLKLHSWHVNGNTCAACALSQFATDINLLTALGALTLATLSPHNWRKRKRVYFLESQIQHLHDWTLGSNAEPSKQKMFELGSELRRIRERLRLLHDRHSGDRSHVAEAVAQYYDASVPPPRPLR
ncbi:hypothetical protein LTR33_015028 [Friedmanniomyces endolithicus]|nr:hypothetical protein LTR33_015028 [Friedmanniomyces endolithicus]